MKKNEKLTWERCVFKRMDVFFDKIWTWELFIYREWTFFDKIWAWEQWFFHEKLEKKGILFIFVAHNGHNRLQFWQNCFFFLTNRVHDSRGFSMKKVKKRTWEHRVLREWTVFWLNMGMTATCFLENGQFFNKICARE